MITPIERLRAIVMEGFKLGWISDEEAAAALLSLYQWEETAREIAPLRNIVVGCPICSELAENIGKSPQCKYKGCTFDAGSGGEYCDEHR